MRQKYSSLVTREEYIISIKSYCTCLILSAKPVSKELLRGLFPVFCTAHVLHSPSYVHGREKCAHYSVRQICGGKSLHNRHYQIGNKKGYSNGA